MAFRDVRPRLFSNSSTNMMVEPQPAVYPKTVRHRAPIPGRVYGRTAALLAALVDEPHGITPSDLHRRLKIPKSTLSLIFRHFVDLGIAARALDDAGFVAGPELIRLALRIVSNLQIPRLARPHLESLAR